MNEELKIKDAIQMRKEAQKEISAILANLMDKTGHVVEDVRIGYISDITGERNISNVKLDMRLN